MGVLMAQHEPPKGEPSEIMAAELKRIMVGATKVPIRKPVSEAGIRLTAIARPVATRAVQRPRQAEEPWVDVPMHPKGAYDAIAWPEKRRQLAVQQVDTHTNTLPSIEVVTYQEKESFMNRVPGAVKYPLFAAIFLLLYLGWVLVTSAIQDANAIRGIERMNLIADGELSISKKELEKQKINSQIAVLKLTKNAPVAVTTNTTNQAPNYDCGTVQSSENGYNSGVVHQLSDTSNSQVTFNGCVSMVVDDIVAGISGEGFQILFPETPGSNNVYKSPTSQNPDAGVFWNKIANDPKYSGQIVRIILTPNGHVTITKKGG